MAIVSNTVGYLDGDVILEGFFAFDDSIEGQRPTIMVNHTWVGRNAFVEEKVLKLAGMGYFSFAVDMYGKGVLGKDKEACSHLMQPFMEDRSLVLSRMEAALYAIKRMPWVDEKNIAAIGFCFGGLCVLDLARSGVDIQGVVSFHGLLVAPEIRMGKKVKAKILMFHGNEDPMSPKEQIIAIENELTESGADWQFHNYGNTLHAFTNPAANDSGFGTVYQADADKRSWQSMINFLQEIFS